MNIETKNTQEIATEQMDGMKELHDAELDAIVGASKSDCPTWANTSKSWGF